MSDPAARQFARYQIPMCVAALFTIKCAVMWQLKDHILLQQDAGLDTSVYLKLTQQVMAGDIALGPGLYFVSPLYIYVAASILAVADSVIWLRLVQIVFGTASVALIWWCGREWAGSRAAWCAAGLASLTGLFTFYEALLLQAAIDPFLTSLALAALTAALTRSRWTWFLAAGAAFGIQSLNRPNILIAAAGLIVLLLLSRRSRGAAAMVAGLLLALAPVTIRNGLVADDWSPLSSHGGLNFYIGNNPAADGTYVMIPSITPSIVGQQQDARRVAELAVGHELDDAGISSHFYRSALQWIREHPWPAARLFARKLVYVFNSAHLSLNYSYPFYAYDADTALRALAVGPWLLIPLGLTGVASLAWTRRDGAFCIWAAFIPLYAVAVAAFFVSERYRLPLLVPLCVASGAALDSFSSALASRRWRRVGALLGLIGLLGLGANWPLGLDDARAEERTRMAERSAMLNRLDDAEAWTAKAEEIHPTPGVVHFRVGRALAVRGRPVAALSHLQEAARLDPDRPETSYALGQALMDAGRASEAVPHLRRALKAGVRPDLAGFDLARALDAAGDRQSALQVQQDVKPAHKDDAASWYQMGQLAQQWGDSRLAARYYGEAVSAAPGAFDLRQRLGLMLALLGDFEAAVRELERAVKLNPSDATARLNLAVACAQLGRTNDARVQAREALRLDPGYVKARELLKA
ncbi:MAG: tetratricopeptide repeat protein, partial [Acidobacteriota bacterium]|nr:tetratricopeptide repeat protein [Acidobacteriota bacterium]